MTIQVERSHPGVRYRLAVPDGWTSFPVQAARLRPAIAGGCFADSRTDLGMRQSPCAAERRTSWCSSRSRPESSTPSSYLSFRLTWARYPSRQRASSRSCHGICPMTGQWQRSSRAHATDGYR